MDIFESIADNLEVSRHQQGKRSKRRRNGPSTAVKIMMHVLGRPDQMFASVLVAGTNGKGSTCATLANIFYTAGYRVGLFTSPHIKDVRERIQVWDKNNKGKKLIEKKEFIHLFRKVSAIGDHFLASGGLKRKPRPFEFLTVMAMSYFSKEKIDIAIIEVGVGGLRDATNIIEPIASIVCDIGFDHMDMLGSTLSEITFQKTGIFRKDAPAVYLQQIDEIDRMIKSQILEKGCVDTPADHTLTLLAAENFKANQAAQFDDVSSIRPSLLGPHQLRNSALALTAARAISDRFPVLPGVMQEGIGSTVWEGRLDLYSFHDRKVILDIAHNPSGVAAICQALKTNSRLRPSSMIFGCMEDKCADEMLSLLIRELPELANRSIFFSKNVDRWMAIEKLKETAISLEFKPKGSSDILDALLSAVQLTEPGASILLLGSNYIVKEALGILSEKLTL